MQFEKRTVLVTGASNGIGESFARIVAAQGADLVLVARREARLKELQAELLEQHPSARVEVFAADLSEAGSGEAVAGFVAGAGLTVDVLINNAGVGSHDRFVDEDPAALARQIQLNCATLVDLTHRFLPGMLRRGSGAVVNVASTAAFQPVPTMAVYAAGKAFVLSFTEALWAETRSGGVRVLCLCPGATETAFFANTGKEFLTGGRQTPDEVVRTALKALDGNRPTVVSGLANRLSSTGYRFVPRSIMSRVSGRIVAAA